MVPKESLRDSLGTPKNKCEVKNKESKQKSHMQWEKMPARHECNGPLRIKNKI
jgi:hypothetical protein